MALPEDRLIPIEKFPDAARRFISPDAPARLKEMLSKGLVPMKPVVQLCSLYQIAMAETGALHEEAKKTVLNMPDTSLKQVIKQPMLPLVLP